MKQRRVGKIIIPYKAIDSTVTEAMFVWLRFVPLHVELMGHTDKFECIGISHAFDVLEDGFVSPEYRIEISVDTNDTGKDPVYGFKAIKV